MRCETKGFRRERCKEPVAYVSIDPKDKWGLCARCYEAWKANGRARLALEELKPVTGGLRCLS